MLVKHHLQEYNSLITLQRDTGSPTYTQKTWRKIGNQKRRTVLWPFQDLLGVHRHHAINTNGIDKTGIPSSAMPQAHPHRELCLTELVLAAMTHKVSSFICNATVMITLFTD